MDLCEYEHREFSNSQVRPLEKEDDFEYTLKINNWSTPECMLFFSSDAKPTGVQIPGFGSVTRESCGTVRAVIRCCETKNKRIAHNNCYQSSCPVCYPAWTARQAERTVKRCFALHQINRIHHWSISFSKSCEDYEEMKRILKYCFPHSFWFFHPFRLQDVNGKSYRDKEADRQTLRWVYGPHFHVLTWESRMNTTEMYNDYGAVVHHIQKLDNTFDDFARLLTYEYSHIGLVRKISGRWQSLSGSFGIFAPSKLNKILFADNVKGYHVKCNCEECKDKQNLEDRADTEISKVELIHRQGARVNETYIIVSEFHDLNQYETHLSTEKFYFPKLLLKDINRFNYYLARLGLLRYIKHEDFKRAHQISLDTKKFIGYVEGSGRKALRKPHKSMYPQVFVAEYFQK